ncbi:MAG: ATP-binding protein [Candidatus Sericytochromatia bacterium]|nr:ATP-binding protein [Candidatus Sericytochromatia bacterium]
MFRGAVGLADGAVRFARTLGSHDGYEPGFVVLDTHGRWLGASSGWQPVLAGVPVPGVGRPFVESLTPRSRDLWIGRWLAHARGERVPPFEVCFADLPAVRFRASLSRAVGDQLIVHLVVWPSEEPAGGDRFLGVLQGLYAHFPSGVVLTDLEGQVLWVNGLLDRMGGKGWHGRLLSRCLPGIGLGRVLGRVARTAVPARLRGVDVASVGLGSVRFLDLAISRVEQDCGSGFALLVLVDDATRRVLEEQERARAVAEQGQLDRLKNQFLSTASHELRTPLSLITGYAEFLEDGLGGELTPSQAEYVRGIQAGARQLQEMVDDLLDFTRLQDGSFELHCHDLDVARLLPEIVAAFEARARDHGIRLVLRPDRATLPAYGDREAVARILHALVGNALKFTPVGGQVEIRARLEETRLLVEIEDDGIGIGPEHLPHVFERFYQADPGLTRLHGGVGLGLTVAKALVEGQRGRIGVRSQSGAGSCFWFTLPLRPRGSART